jgi:hypothetical protein
VNAGLVAFTSTAALNHTWATRVWIFIVMSGGIMIAKTIVAIYVPDTPEEVEIQLKRQKFYLSKIIDNVPDEDNSGLLTNIKSKIQYTIRFNDDDPL